MRQEQPRQEVRRIAFGISLVAFNTLMVELLLTRVFDVILYPNIGYMIITSALFSFGLAGVYATLRPLPAVSAVPGLLRWLSVGLAASLLLIHPGLNSIPFQYEAIAGRPVFQLFCFLGVYVLITLPFFFAGLTFAWTFTTYARHIQVLYFWDLLGAAAGSVVLIPLLPPVGPGGGLLIAAGVALLAAFVFSPLRPRWLLPAAATALMLFPFLVTDYIDFVEHKPDRGLGRARATGNSELVRWDPISKIEVIDIGSVKNIIYDGGSQASFIYPFDGNYRQLRRTLEIAAEQNTEGAFLRQFWQRGVVASHWLRVRAARRVLVIGSAAGQEIRSALAFGALQVDAVEMVGEVISLGQNEYRVYNGNVLNHPRVNVIRGEGRAFLRAADAPYDIIQIFSNHSSSSVAAGAGAMDPTYLLTADAFEEYFAGLEEDGILHVNHHIYPRIVTTAALGWRQSGRAEFRRHVVVIMRYPTVTDTLPTVLIKMTPWTEPEMKRLRLLYSIGSHEDPYYEIVEDPLRSDRSYLPSEFYSGALPDAVIDASDYRILPTTDDRPYFRFLRRQMGKIVANDANFLRPEVAYLLNAQVEQGGGIPMDVVHLVVATAVSLIFALVVIGIPIMFARVWREPWPGKSATLVYFSCLGAGFIILELTFIQEFWRFIGFPLHTYSVVLFTLLLAAGVGSLASKRLGVSPAGRWALPFVGTLGYGAAFLLTHEWFFDSAMDLQTWVRIGVSVLILFPFGFFMGMAFPLGILCIEQRSRAGVAWAWGLNGLFTVIGGLGSVLLSVYWGFTAAQLVALGIYGVAFVALYRLRACRAEGVA